MRNNEIGEKIQERVQVGLNHGWCNIQGESIVKKCICIIIMVVSQIPTDVLSHDESESGDDTDTQKQNGDIDKPWWCLIYRAGPISCRNIGHRFINIFLIIHIGKSLLPDVKNINGTYQAFPSVDPDPSTQRVTTFW